MEGMGTIKVDVRKTCGIEESEIGEKRKEVLADDEA